MDDQRLAVNYPARRGFLANPMTSKLDHVFVIPARLQINDRFVLIFRGWQSDQAFESRQEPLGYLDVKFSLGRANVENANAEVFAAIRAKALEFLEITDDYEITNLEINLENLTIEANARHEAREQFVNRYVRTVEEFEQVKAENQEFVGLVLGFAWQFGAAKNSFLNTLE